MAQPDPARIPATARIALPRLIAGDPEVVHVRLQEQAHRYTSPICVICWDGLCGFDTDLGEERVVVSWNSCGHTFHKSCITGTLIEAQIKGLLRLTGKCPTCNRSNTYQPAASKEPYTRIYLSIQDGTDAEVVPFTINLPDGTSAHTNIIAIAHAARTDLETVTAKVQEHLQQWRMPYGSPRSSRPRPSEICRSLVGAQATIEKIVTELLHQRYLAAFEGSVSALRSGANDLAGFCWEFRQILPFFTMHRRLKAETAEAEAIRNRVQKETADAMVTRDQVQQEIADGSLLESEWFRRHLLDKEFALRAEFESRYEQRLLDKESSLRAEFQSRYEEEMRDVVTAHQGQHQQLMMAQQNAYEQLMVAQHNQYAAQQSHHEHEIIRLRQEIERLNS